MINNIDEKSKYEKRRTKVLNDVIKLMRKLNNIEVNRQELFAIIPKDYFKEDVYLYKPLYSELEQDTIFLIKDSASSYVPYTEPKPTPTKVNKMYVKLYGYVGKKTFDYDDMGNELFTVKDLKNFKSFLKKVEKDFDSEKRERKWTFRIAIISLVVTALSFIFGGNGIRSWTNTRKKTNQIGIPTEVSYVELGGQSRAYDQGTAEIKP